MESTAKSTRSIHIAILILMCIPIIWSIGTHIYTSIRFNAYNGNDSFIYWFVIRTLISILFLYMIFKRMYGIMLYLCVASVHGLTTSVIQWTTYHASFDTLSLIFSGLSLVKLVLMIILLNKEHKRFFNLRFTSTALEYPITYKRIRNLNILLTLLGLISFISVFAFVSNEPIVLYNGYVLFLSLLLIFTIIGTASNSKFQLLAFMFALIFISDVFHSSQSILLMAFAGNSNNGWDQIGTIIGLAVISFLLVFGILIFFILRSYLIERKNSAEMFLVKEDLLD